MTLPSIRVDKHKGDGPHRGSPRVSDDGTGENYGWVLGLPDPWGCKRCATMCVCILLSQQWPPCPSTTCQPPPQHALRSCLSVVVGAGAHQMQHRGVASVLPWSYLLACLTGGPAHANDAGAAACPQAGGRV